MDLLVRCNRSTWPESCQYGTAIFPYICSVGPMVRKRINGNLLFFTTGKLSANSGGIISVTHTTTITESHGNLQQAKIWLSFLHDNLEKRNSLKRVRNSCDLMLLLTGHLSQVQCSERIKKKLTREKNDWCVPSSQDPVSNEFSQMLQVQSAARVLGCGGFRSKRQLRIVRLLLSLSQKIDPIQRIAPHYIVAVSESNATSSVNSVVNRLFMYRCWGFLTSTILVLSRWVEITSTNLNLKISRIYLPSTWLQLSQ